MSHALSWWLSRVCANIADRWSWYTLCSKCERVYARYSDGSPVPDYFSDSPPGGVGLHECRAQSDTFCRLYLVVETATRFI